MATFTTRTTATGRKRIQARVSVAGHRRQHRTHETMRAARAWAREVEQELRAGNWHPEAKTRTVGELIDRYCARYLHGKKTAGRTRQRLQFWRRRLGETPIAELRPFDITEGRDALATTKAPATVVRYLAALSHVFTIGIRDLGWCEQNPVRMILWPREPRGRVRFLSDEEHRRLVAACETSRCEALAPLVRLAWMTGARRGELLGLRWRDVDLARKRIVLQETKNNERRQVPLVGEACDVLRALPGNHAPNDRVFHRPGRPERALDIRHYWPQALRRARITDFRFHDLRHTAASYLAMSGASTQEIAEILGHRTLSMVKRYAHLTTSHAADVLERMVQQQSR